MKIWSNGPTHPEVIEEQMYVLISFGLEKLRSPLATETGRVKRIPRVINVLGAYVSLFFLQSSKHLVVMLTLEVVLQWLAIQSTSPGNSSYTECAEF